MYKLKEIIEFLPYLVDEVQGVIRTSQDEVEKSLTNNDKTNYEVLISYLCVNEEIEKNMHRYKNANMYEIMDLMISRNNCSLIAGKNYKIDPELDKLLSLRNESLTEFFENVPECKPLFDAIKDGLKVRSKIDREFICKFESVPFYINNTRLRGKNGDIAMSKEKQKLGAEPDFQHENYAELANMVEYYKYLAPEEIKDLIEPIIVWINNNSKDKYRGDINLHNNEVERNKVKTR